MTGHLDEVPDMVGEAALATAFAALVSALQKQTTTPKPTSHHIVL